jgi:capsular exopolysaccharide synthesis family protein
MDPKQLVSNQNGAPNDDDADGGGLDLHEVFDSFRKRRLFIFSCIGIGLLCAILICVFMTPRYDAVADLNIHPESSGALDIGDLAEMASGAGGLDWDAKVQTEVLIISSVPREWDVISKLRLDQNKVFMKPGILDKIGACKLVSTPPDRPIESVSPCVRYKILQRFNKALDVHSLPKSQVVEIRFRSADPKLAADVANRLSASYLQYNFVTRYEATMQASGWLHDRLGVMKQDVEDAGAQLAAYQESANIIGTDDTDNLAVNQLSDMGKQATDAEADRILKEARYRLAMTGNPELIGTIVPDSVLPTLRSQEAQLNTQLAQASAEYGPRYPKVVQLQSQLDEVHRALGTETDNIQSRFKSEYEAAVRTEEALHKSMDRLKQDAFSQSAKFNRFVLLKNEAEAKEQLYDDLLKKLNEAGVSAGLKSTNVDVISPAESPVKAALPNNSVFLVVGTAAGLLFGIVGTFVLENLDSSVRSLADVQSAVQLSVMGILPHLPQESARVGKRLEGSEHMPLAQRAIQRAQSEYTEAVNSLRTSLLLASAGSPPKVVMLTSSLPSEGKSLTSINLASSLALSGRRVLLVDADLRRGARVRDANGRQIDGLTGCLSGAQHWRDAVQTISMESGELKILPSGIRPPNPAELLGSKTMGNLIEEWRKEFDFVVVDTPPVVVVTDAVALSPLMDAVFVVVRINQTPRFALREGCSRLSAVSRKLTGIVVNDVDIAKQYYGYGYGNHRKYYSYYVSNDESQS